MINAVNTKKDAVITAHSWVKKFVIKNSQQLFSVPWVLKMYKHII